MLIQAAIQLYLLQTIFVFARVSLLVVRHKSSDHPAELLIVDLLRGLTSFLEYLDLVLIDRDWLSLICFPTGQHIPRSLQILLVALHLAQAHDDPGKLVVSILSVEALPPAELLTLDLLIKGVLGLLRQQFLNF